MPISDPARFYLFNSRRIGDQRSKADAGIDAEYRFGIK